MKRYIDMDELLESLEELKASPYCSEERDKKLGMTDSIDMLSLLVKSAPVIDAIPIEYLKSKMPSAKFTCEPIMYVITQWEKQNAAVD